MAAYVAALGEVKESWGKMGAKQKYFKHIEMSFIDILDLWNVYVIMEWSIEIYNMVILCEIVAFVEFEMDLGYSKAH